MEKRPELCLSSKEEAAPQHNQFDLAPDGGPNCACVFCSSDPGGGTGAFCLDKKDSYMSSILLEDSDHPGPRGFGLILPNITHTATC